MSALGPNGRLVSSLASTLRHEHSNWVGVGLRIGAISGKFFLTAYLAKYLPLADLGVYGLIVTTSHLAMFPLGFAFYAFSGREMLAGDRKEVPHRVRDQAAFHAVAYALVLPALVAISWMGIIPHQLLVWFIAIVALTHVSQEIVRILTVLGQPRDATVVHFLSHGLWAYLVLLTAFLWPASRSLTGVLAWWTAGGLLGVGSGIVFLHRHGFLARSTNRIDWAWIRRGMRVSAVFFAASMAYKIIERSDLYFVEAYRGVAQVGVYSTFGQIARLVEDLVTTGFIMVLYPKLVEAYRQDRQDDFRNHLAQLARGTALWAAPVVLGLSLGIYPLLLFLGKEEFFQHLPAFFLMLIGQGVALAAIVPHYALYAQGRDGIILATTILAMGISIVLNSILVPRFGLVGAAISGIVAFGTMGFLKYTLYRRQPYRDAIAS